MYFLILFFFKNHCWLGGLANGVFNLRFFGHFYGLEFSPSSARAKPATRKKWRSKKESKTYKVEGCYIDLNDDDIMFFNHKLSIVEGF
jgi:hypothetical protein